MPRLLPAAVVVFLLQIASFRVSAKLANSQTNRCERLDRT
jgi:hypothetical protein